MAADETILQAVNEGLAPPTLRFYQWERPTLSLGYFQKHDHCQQQDQTIRDLPVVRRLTGGGAILHADELTYSLTLPLNKNLPHSDIQGMYKLVHDACIAALKKLGIDAHYHTTKKKCRAQRGPFFCFDRRHCLDLVINDQKLLGSAQRRLKNAALQHGSLILNQRYRQQPSAALMQYTKSTIHLQNLIADITLPISQNLHLAAQNYPLSQPEESHLVTLEAEYNDAPWTRRC